MPKTVTYFGGRIFDGSTLHDSKAARFENGVFVGLDDNQAQARSDQTVDLEGDILSVGYVDLQVNGGGGVMFNDDPSVETLEQIAEAHRRLGTVKFLPTLISDSIEKTQAAITAARLAIAQGFPGVAGLHLEGPHLSVARKGAHDAKFIRPMEDADLRTLLDAKADLPVLKVTVAPENVTPEQVAAMAKAGILVSLGHTDADFDTCLAYGDSGARVVTHLFNAMSQLGSRNPGLVGAALYSGELCAGLIADGSHVHPVTMRAAWAAKTGPCQIFLVSDAMALAGTDLTEFKLNGRTIRREDGRLTLSDGTLAGADLELTSAIAMLVSFAGVDLEQALGAATTVPAKVCGLPAHGLQKGITLSADMIRISKHLRGVRPLGGSSVRHL